MNRISKFLLGMMMICLSSCASIPHATVEMSVLLGQQIDALEQGHITMVDAFYKEKRTSSGQMVERTMVSGLFERFVRYAEYH